MVCSYTAHGWPAAYHRVCSKDALQVSLSNMARGQLSICSSCPDGEVDDSLLPLLPTTPLPEKGWGKRVKSQVALLK